MKFVYLFSVLLVLLVSGCQNSPCKIQDRPESIIAAAAAVKAAKESPNLENPAYEKISKEKSLEKIKIFKPDGSLQCGQGKSISVTEMLNDLKGIEIYSSERKHDGLMRIQVCGQPTGNSNVYEIKAVDLEKVKALGFKLWTRG